MEYFVITIGTRDIQILKEKVDELKQRIDSDFAKYLYTNENLPDYYCFRQPRESGKKLVENYDQIKDLLSFPMIDPFIDYILNNENEEDELTGVLIYTDQENLQDDSRQKKQDTIYFKDIIEKHLRDKYKIQKINSLKVSENVDSIDDQYRMFGKELDKILILPDEVKNVYLFPQGGIDQINQAITLQLIQRYRSKVIYCQKPENVGVRKLTFPSLFLNDLRKNILKHHLDMYGFDRIDEDICPFDWLYLMCRYASARLSLNDREARQCYSEMIRKIADKALRRSINHKLLTYTSLQPIPLNRRKLQDLYVNIKIKFCKQSDYRNFLIGLYTLSENLEKQFVDEYFGVDTMVKFFNLSNYDQDNKEWIDFLKDKLGHEFIERLEQDGIRLYNPNLPTYKEIFIELLDQGKIPHLNNCFSISQYHIYCKAIDKLRGKRNQIAHRLSNPTINELNGEIRGTGFSDFSELFDFLDCLLNVNGFDDFDFIKDVIEKHI